MKCPVCGGEIKIPVELKDEGQNASPVEISIINVADPALFDQYLASSRGQDAIINIIGVRSRA